MAAIAWVAAAAIGFAPKCDGPTKPGVDTMWPKAFEEGELVKYRGVIRKSKFSTSEILKASFKLHYLGDKLSTERASFSKNPPFSDEYRPGVWF